VALCPGKQQISPLFGCFDQAIADNQLNKSHSSLRVLMDIGSAAQTSSTLLRRLRQDASSDFAWSEFVRRYGAQILQWCRKWNLQEADAQDVTQNVLVKLAAKMRSFTYDPARSFRAYLKTLTNYALCDFLETRKQPGAGAGGSAAMDVLQTLQARDDLVQHLKTAFDQELLEEAMARVQERVEPHTWEAFQLTAFQGLSGAAVAQQLSMKIATVFKARSKVQQMLQEEIGKLEEPPS
jgi:RNA polymerase sigma factor (sigma-70 family)